MGGFDLTITNPDGSTGCSRQSPATAANGGPTADYIPHHAWFQYYASTANPAHTRPTVPPRLYGTSADTVTNHEYDIHDFFDALKAGNLPAVSSSRRRQIWTAMPDTPIHCWSRNSWSTRSTRWKSRRLWNSTAVVINWDDSDGWYDHQMSPIVNSSAVLNSCQSIAIRRQS